MTPRTIFLSRLIGLYLVVAAVSMATHREIAASAMATVIQNPAFLWLGGLIALLAGLAIVLVHNCWSGGVRVVLVTLVGWLAIAKGIVFLFVPMGSSSAVSGKGLSHPVAFYCCTAVIFLFGAFFTWSGFSARSKA